MIIIIVQYKKNRSKILIQTIYKDYQRKLLKLKNSTKIMKIIDFLPKKSI